MVQRHVKNADLKWDVAMQDHDGGLSLAEVADSLDVALTTVKTQFARAVLKLQSKLQPHSPGPTDPGRPDRTDPNART